MIVIGFDPGITGAIAVVQFLKGGRSRILDVLDMPTLGGKRKVVDAVALCDWLEGFAPDLTAEDWHAVIEDVHSMPGNGHVGAFSFGRSKGVLEGITTALGIPTTLVRPARWKGDLDLSSDKNESRYAARLAWPDSDDLFERVKDDGRAEAALLAAWGAQHIVWA